MIALSATIRKDFGKKVKNLREKDVIPAVLYGPKIKNQNLEISQKDFEKVYQVSGESSLVSLEIEGKKTPVLIHSIQWNPVNERPIHG